MKKNVKCYDENQITKLQLFFRGEDGAGRNEWGLGQERMAGTGGVVRLGV